MKTIRQIIRDIPQHWVGDGFPVRSLFSYAGGNRFDPFLLLDYAGPHQFAPAEATRGVGEHPHRGFETVTIVYQGPSRSDIQSTSPVLSKRRKYRLAL